MRRIHEATAGQYLIWEQLEERIVLDGAVDDVSCRVDVLSAQVADTDAAADSLADDAFAAALGDPDTLALETLTEWLQDGTWHYWERDWGGDGNGYEFHSWQDGSSSFHQIQWDAALNSKGTHNGFDYNLQRDGSWAYQAVQWDASQNGYDYNAASTGVYTYHANQWSDGMGYSYACNSNGQWMYHVIETGDAIGDVREYDADSTGYYDFTYTWANGTQWNDGSANHPYLVKDIVEGAPFSNPCYLTDVNGTVYFGASDGVAHGWALWKSDGTENGTVLVKDLSPGQSETILNSLTNINGTLYFVGPDPSFGIFAGELWKSDGTESGTLLVKDIRPISAHGPTFLTAVGDSLYFAIDDGVHGNEVWKSDGTEGGTVMVKDLVVGADGSAPAWLTNVNGVLYFSTGTSLWRSDGTDGGTVCLKHFYEYPISSLTNVDGTVYFAACGETGGYELWKSDGTETGTVMVKDINTGGHGTPRYLTNVNGTLYFVANDGIHGEELWKSQGGDSDTFMVKDILVGTGSGNCSQLTNANGVLYFSANDGIHGREVWTSGASGTYMVKDVNPGSGSAINSYGTTERAFAHVNGTVYFSADDSTHGWELWRTNGTESGTVLVNDTELGSAGGDPIYLTSSAGTLYLTYDGSANGRELWALRVERGPAVA